MLSFVIWSISTDGPSGGGSRADVACVNTERGGGGGGCAVVLANTTTSFYGTLDLLWG